MTVIKNLNLCPKRDRISHDGVYIRQILIFSAIVGWAVNI